ncbi:YhcB family protein [Thorsellia anophelis]|uniref:Z-ring associated protein G n=1 Tax=Thorsellia anophelis DSM 18579 TaxID=1123402 RepID=A0A1H9Y852_9GAMM|nr:DUF1043 family protein [Thorsellia anophelis]SES64995.1 hypothetical protein SAMN02583745_00110 [Thorsellia anophelis DSM 18579]
MIWEYLLIGAAAGLVLGFILGRISKKSPDAEILRKELDKTRSELETYKQEMIAHFSNSSDILDKMARDYRQLYDWMAKSSKHLISNTDIKNTPFPKLQQSPNNDTVGTTKPTYDAPPRDYSDGSSGLFNKGLDSEEKVSPSNNTK